ncbi:MAG TPA: hypothetical protein VF193_14020 [Steroidobacter sp.]
MAEVMRLRDVKRSATRGGAVVLLVVAMLGVDSACAQGDFRSDGPGGTETSEGRDSEDERRTPPLEEITVRGEKPLVEYRLEMEAAREHVYAVFNEINGDDELDVYCRNESRPGTRVPRRVCRPRFESDVSNRAAKEYLAALFSVCPFGATQACIFSERAQLGMSRAQAAESESPYKHHVLAEEMQRLVQEDSRLLDAIRRYEELERAYQQARERRSD